MNLSTIDLDLFVVLQVLLEEQSATRAAARLHVTRPAVSNALSRLRALLDDPLFVRTRRGLVATPHALSLRPALDAALGTLAAIADARVTFDPAMTTRRFTIACSDAEQFTILPLLIERFARQMPSATLRLVPIDEVAIRNGLQTGDVDLLIGTPHPTPDSHASELLYHDGYSVIARRGHPALRRRLHPTRLWSLPCVDIALLGDRPTFGRTVVGIAREAAQRDRTVVMTVPSFSAAAMVVSHTELVAIVPSRFAAAIARQMAIDHRPLALRLPPIPTYAVWHPRSNTEPASQALRRMVVHAADGWSRTATR